jgi:hypothetical protein
MMKWITLTVVMFCGIAPATTYYVDPGGTNSADTIATVEAWKKQVGLTS